MDAMAVDASETTDVAVDELLSDGATLSSINGKVSRDGPLVLFLLW